MKTIRVNLGERSYDILVEKGILNDIGPLLSKFRLSKECLIITNGTVDTFYGDQVTESLKDAGFKYSKILVKDGEEAKSLSVVEDIYHHAVKFGLSRNSAIIALGGGVIGDLAGFAAATYMRGIPFVQVPTTLLAQVDSSVGGKVAVNFLGYKNLIGSFYQPLLVIIDPETLKTLPLREFRAGAAEVIKYGIIWDKEFFVFLDDNVKKILDFDWEAIEHIITRSCEIKAEVVSADERESSLRMILNFGHTFGHVIETLGGLKLYKHGEAVSIGMCMEALLAERIGLLHKNEAERILDLISAFELPSSPDFSLEPEMVIKVIDKDKKNREGKITFVLPEYIGKVKMVQFERRELLRLIRENFV
ncbi:MAG: 3-dehydroquinate synthase [Clostridia bacterium 41_269]|nr:MAG: 3-dehydroquinate synthase [Clostridia bacterium 41_269]